MAKYLLIGHITEDLIPAGKRLGGTVTYSGLTATALGQSVRILTACADNTDLSPINALELTRIPSEFTTTFENVQTKAGRIQFLHKSAVRIPEKLIRSQNAEIMHFAPVMQDFDFKVIQQLCPNTFIGVTPQGWMRTIGTDMQVQHIAWRPEPESLARVNALVCSEEDIAVNENMLDYYRRFCNIVALTRGESGASIFTKKKTTEIQAPSVSMVEATGAGDVFAAAFFSALQAGAAPDNAGRFAVNLATQSVTRIGLESIPTAREIQYNSNILTLS